MASGLNHDERSPTRRPRRSHLLVAAIGVIVSVLYLAEALRYSRGSLDQPGPGLYPILVAVLLLVGSLGTGLEDALRPSRDVQVAWPARQGGWRVLAIVLTILGYVVLLPYLGWAVAGFLVTLVVLHLMNLRRWPLKIALALLIGVGSSYTFAMLLDVPLPPGVWSR